MKYFKEEQRFDQWWLYAIIIANSLGLTTFFGYVVYEQVYLKKPWGNEPLSDSMLIAVALAGVTISLIIVWGLFTARLETQIKNRTIHYRFQPFIWSWRKIRFDEVEEAEVKKTRRVGMRRRGYHYSFRSGTSFIVKGTYGLQLKLKSGKKLFIGTQKPDELKLALSQISDQQEENYG